ncbi:SCO4402 family protein [Crossiella sp. CA198]|uniref:SCO4402 family protein n=1 Tax=Crossiella sp. CA198 TaxID=3455607 RepID=UPI003F8D60E1
MNEVAAEGVDAGLLAWCVVANVAAETAHGPGGQEIRQGLRHFVPGAKVWVLPPQWGDGGDLVMVIGRHRGRGQGRLARMVVARVHLTGFRAQGVYNGAVHRELVRPWLRNPPRNGDGPLRQWESREEAEEVAAYWNTVCARQGGVRRPQRRGELIEILQVLADATPRTVRPGPQLTYRVKRLISELFENSDDLRPVTGGLLRDQVEAAALTDLLGPLRACTDELGPGWSDVGLLSHRHWPRIALAARVAHTMLTDQLTD